MSVCEFLFFLVVVLEVYVQIEIECLDKRDVMCQCVVFILYVSQSRFYGFLYSKFEIVQCIKWCDQSFCGDYVGKEWNGQFVDGYGFIMECYWVKMVQ